MKFSNLTLILIYLCGANAAHAGFHGDVSEVRNTPGYIESNPQSDFFRGVAVRKDRNDRIERRSPSELLLSFFQGDALDLGKLTAFSNELKGYDDNAYLVLCQSDSGKTTPADCDQDASVQKDWKKNGFHIAVKFARKQIEAVSAHASDLKASELNAPKNSAVVEQLFSALETWEAIKAEDEQRSSHSSTLTGILDAKALFEKNIVSADRPDASNLLVPVNHPLYGKQTFLSEKDLETLKAGGSDLSLLDPPSTGMWRKPKVAVKDYKTARNNDDGLVQLKKLYSDEDAKNIMDPEYETSAVFKLKVPDGGKSPKFDVYIGKTKWKLKFLTDRTGDMSATDPVAEIQKLAWNSEVNVEPVVNNLAGAMGFTIDPTYYKKKVRVYFEDKIYADQKFDESLEKMKEMLAEHFGKILNITSGLKVVKTDSSGRKYIEIKSVTFELKSNPDTDLKLGLFDHVGMGKDLMREHRAFSLFLAFICDLDVKNENDAVKLVPNGNSYKVMDQSSDMGNGLALGYPNIYNFPFVHGVTRDQAGQVQTVQINYPRYYPLPMLKVVNINDARWFGRLLGQLTSTQIETAFRNAGYPALVAKYYGLIVAKKRNDFLKALDLIGSNFKDSLGNSVSLQALPEFTGTIPGYDTYFKNGLLTDPNDSLFDPSQENWPRHWGISRRIFDEDEKLDHEIRMMIRNSAVEFALKAVSDYLNRAEIHNHGGGFEFARIIDHNLGHDCGNDCFIQGADFGLQSFVPMRYLIDSPMLREDPSKPLWVVDVMRIGFYAGDRGEGLQGLLGFEVPSAFAVSVGGRGFKIYEIVKVTPISGMSEFFDDTKNFLQLPKYTLPHLRDQVVSSLTNGQSLVVSTYTGGEAAAKIKLTGTPFFSIRLGGSIEHVDRTTIYHQDEQYSVNWSRGQQKGAQAGLNVFDFLFKVPLAKQSWGSGNKLESTFTFQDSGSDKELLMSNLVRPDVSAIPDSYKWENRQTKTRSRAGLLSFLGIRSVTRFLNKVEIHYENFRTQVQSTTKKLALSTEVTRLRDIVNAHWTKKAEVLVDDKGAVGLSLDFNLTYPAAEKEKLLPVLEKYHSYFPSSLFFFDKTYVKHYMGDVTADAKTYYNEEMLDKLFGDSWTAASICAVYPAGCNAAFYRHYQSIRASYAVVKAQGCDARDRFYKRMARFFLDHDESVEFAKIVIGEKALLQDAQIDSTLSAFPGEQAEISWGDQMTAPANLFDPKLFSDRIESSLSTLYFAPVVE